MPPGPGAPAGTWGEPLPAGQWRQQPPPGQWPQQGGQWGTPPPGQWAGGAWLPQPGYSGAGAAGGPRASFGARLAALLIDGLITSALTIPVYLVAVLLLVVGPKAETTCNDGSSTCEYPHPAMIAIVVVLGLAAVVLITVLYTIRPIGRRGQTLGKRVMGVMVVDRASGQPIGIGRSVGRFFMTAVSSWLCYLGYLWMLWDADRQTWHDKVVGSVVVSVNR